MQPLSISRINAIAPYEVWIDCDKIIFTTDYGARIEISFDEDDDVLSSTVVYWFNIANVNGIKSPHDSKLMPTIWVIIEEFFKVNPEVLLYLCDTADDQQAMRARLFHRWFTLYDGSRNFIFRQAEIPDEGIINYVAMIMQRSHPNAEEIATEFDEQAKLFKEKP